MIFHSFMEHESDWGCQAAINIKQDSPYKSFEAIKLLCVLNRPSFPLHIYICLFYEILLLDALNKVCVKNAQSYLSHHIIDHDRILTVEVLMRYESYGFVDF